MKYRLICTLFVLIFAVKLTLAQDETYEDWPIVERCLPEPMIPDDDWTFDGEILMSGWAGIHAVSAKLDTPYVVHWGGGVLSPDGVWVLKQEVDRYTELSDGDIPLATHHWIYDDIVLINTLTGDERVFPWEAHLTRTNTLSNPHLA